MKSAFYSLCCSALFLLAPAATNAVHFDRICSAGDALQAFSYPLFWQIVPVEEQEQWKWQEGALRATPESRQIATSWIPTEEMADSWSRRLSVAIFSADCLTREAESEKEAVDLQSEEEEKISPAQQEDTSVVVRQPYTDTEAYAFVEERIFVGPWVITLRYEEDLTGAGEEEFLQLAARTELWRERFQAFCLP